MSLRALTATTLLLILCHSCSPSSIGEPPVDLDRLANTVADLHLIEGLAQEIPVTIRDSIKLDYGDKVIQDHGFEVSVFEDQMWIVRQEPVWVEALYKKVSDRMAVIEAESSRVPPQIEE